MAELSLREGRKNYNAEYYKRHKSVIIKRQSIYQKLHNKTNDGRSAMIAKTYRMIKKYPEKWKARYTLRNAIRAGRIERGICEVCGNPKVEAHHDDYAKPLEVKWLCHKHHCELEGRWIPK